MNEEVQLGAKSKIGRIGEGVRLPNRNPIIRVLMQVNRLSRYGQNGALFTACSQLVSYSANCYILHSDGCQKK